MSEIGIVVLAAGGSSRLGRSKLLLELPNGKTLIRHVADIVQETPFRPVMVILGRDAEKTRQEVQKMPFSFIVNPFWQKGMSTSLKLGVEALPDVCRACLVVLGDQPFQSVELMQRIVSRYMETGVQAVFPIVDGKRSNPVVLDRSTFASIKDLEGDTGARNLFSRFTTSALSWPDKRLLIDIDTEEDYRKVQSLMQSTSSGNI
jgi:molybdenum cofactor cytidylyltransferase